MKLNAIIAIADRAYPDGEIGLCWDGRAERPRDVAGCEKEGRDLLAMFVACELFETHDPKAKDAEQRETAANAIRNAARELETVACALER